MNKMIDRVPLRVNPRLFDIVIGDIQQGLAAGLPWLDHAFGKAERLVKMIGGKRYYTPNIHIGGNEYMEVSPSDDLGNFSFFVLDDPQTMQWIPGQQGRLRTTYSLIVWLDMRRVPGEDDGRDTESVKAEILHVLNGGFRLRSGSIDVTKIYELAENIYRGFTLDEVDNQFLMHPYAGFRFEGEMIINEPCYN